MHDMGEVPKARITGSQTERVRHLDAQVSAWRKAASELAQQGYRVFARYMLEHMMEQDDVEASVCGSGQKVTDIGLMDRDLSGKPVAGGLRELCRKVYAAEPGIAAFAQQAKQVARGAATVQYPGIFRNLVNSARQPAEAQRTHPRQRLVGEPLRLVVRLIMVEYFPRRIAHHSLPTPPAALAPGNRAVTRTCRRITGRYKIIITGHARAMGPRAVQPG